MAEGPGQAHGPRRTENRPRRTRTWRVGAPHASAILWRERSMRISLATSDLGAKPTGSSPWHNPPIRTSAVRPRGAGRTSVEPDPILVLRIVDRRRDEQYLRG